MRAFLQAALVVMLPWTAMAADLPSRKGLPEPPALPPEASWSGFYIGASVGGTFGASNELQLAGYPVLADVSGAAPGFWATLGSVSATRTLSAGNSGAFIGGGQAGYNWQAFSHVVLGIEADIKGLAGGDGGQAAVDMIAAAPNAAHPLLTALQASKSLNYLGSVRGRLGWLVTPSLLAYGTGGFAYGDVNSSAALAQGITGPGVVAVPPPSLIANSRSSTLTGWTAGGGVEWKFWSNWSAKVEYLYYDLGSLDYGVGLSTINVLACGACTGLTPAAEYGVAKTSVHGHSIQIGLNYHF